MREQTLQTAYGCLLWDFETLVRRAGGEAEDRGLPLPEPQWQPVLACLGREGPAAPAASIAAAAEALTAGQASEQGDLRPLQPIFTHMNGEHPGWFLPPVPQDGVLRMPQQQETVPAARYAEAVEAIRESLRGTLPEQKRLNGLLALLEARTGALPSGGGADGADLSVFDRLKTRAAIGCCFSEYLLDRGLAADFLSGQTVRTEPCFLLYSADLSGIQRFIYTVSDSKALRSLKSRSFFLGLLMEHYVDEILDGCGLSRANLLYSGGGHCYLLLPNTQPVRTLLQDWNETFNTFLLDQFGTGLFAGHGWTACCGNDLINVPAAETPYKEMFRRVSAAISAHKLHRYSPAQLLRLNGRKGGGERECKNCGRSDLLEGELCGWCRCFVQLAELIRDRDVWLVAPEKTDDAAFTLPALNGWASFVFTDEKNAAEALRKHTALRRIYTKNKSCPALPGATRLYVGDYEADSLMDHLADQARGIRRIAVSRMDVDNLGQSFVAGFETEAADPVGRYRYVNLTRTAAFSRQMSLFFQLYVNAILSGSFENRSPLAVRIVYSGGDDVFLVGAWNDVVEASCRIQQDFTRFTCGALTISGGIALFDESYPLRAAAGQTAALEDRAKQEPGKNAISLFDAGADHTYGWQTFREKVLEEKAALLQTFFAAFPERGNSCLYHLMQLLRPQEGKTDAINLARYAYQLARLEPKRSDPRWKCYREFADRMYQWGWNRVDRNQLITAIYLYVYENRRAE